MELKMIIRSLSRAEVRGIDVRAADELGLPTLVLMENAGRGAADWLRNRVDAPAAVAPTIPADDRVPRGRRAR